MVTDIVEKKIWRISGFFALLVDLALAAVVVWLFVLAVPNMEDNRMPPAEFWWSFGIFFVFCLDKGGYLIIQPNEAKVFTFFGKYAGTIRAPGFHWTNPFTKRKSVTLRVRNFSSGIIKVNDASGNPIEIGAVVVWHVTDSAKATFNVESYENFVTVQSETAIRTLASHFPYDSADRTTESLRGNQDEVATELKSQLQQRLSVAGVTINEARLSHLAYAQEIAQVMLRRQQAAAVIAARRLIVDGAVGMVQMALNSLEENGIVVLDNEKRAQMVNNLLVALVSESEAQPVINTGTLYS
jgi:regulator of protease activity HflC (stomatin/prohibitin superfamily)